MPPVPKTGRLARLIARRVEHYATTSSGLSGVEKREAIIDEVIEDLDDALRFPEGRVGQVAEALDGPVMRAILSGVVEHAYEVYKRQQGL